MAIDLPPSPEPLKAELSSLRGESALYDARLGDVAVHIVGAPALADLDFAGAIEDAQDASDAVRRVSETVFRAGYPAALIHYAATGDSLYISVRPAAIGAVDMPEPVNVYFEDLAGRSEPLTDQVFERRRILASLHADRASQAMEPRFQPMAEPGTMRLLAHPNDTRDDADALHLEIGNPGNRFVGRHYVDAELSFGLASGDRFQVDTRDSLSVFNDDEDGDGELHERKLEWNRVSRWGLFGLGGRYLNYDFETALEQGFDLRELLPFLNRLPRLSETPTQEIDGRIWSIEAFWQNVLYADFYRRWTVQLQVDRTGKTLKSDATGERLQQELYNSLELSSDFAGSVLLGEDGELAYQAVLSARRGVGNEDNPLSEADLDYLLWQPQFGFELAWGDHWLYSLDAFGQFSGDVLPEQQQWVLGGRDNLDAYLPGVAVGDEGMLARFEMAYENIEAGGFALTPLIFSNYGISRERRSDGADVDLADVGIGLDLVYRERFEAGLRYARGIHDKGLDEERRERAEANVYFSVALDF